MVPFIDSFFFYLQMLISTQYQKCQRHGGSGHHKQSLGINIVLSHSNDNLRQQMGSSGKILSDTYILILSHQPSIRALPSQWWHWPEFRQRIMVEVSFTWRSDKYWLNINEIKAYWDLVYWWCWHWAKLRPCIVVEAEVRVRGHNMGLAPWSLCSGVRVPSQSQSWWQHHPGQSRGCDVSQRIVQVSTQIGSFINEYLGIEPGVSCF